MELQTNFKPAKLFFEKYTPDNCDHRLPPIIFVHGICSLHTTWNIVWKRIANETQRKAYSIDIRNHGKSEWNKHFSVNALVLDLENFLIENGIKKCVLVSHSLGGKTSMILALTKPDLVDRLVVEEIPLRDANQEEMNIVKALFSYLRKIYLLPKTMTEAEIRKFFSNIMAEKFPGEMYSNMAFFVPLRPDSAGGFTYNFNVSALEKSLEDLSHFSADFEKCQKFHGPTLFLYGETSGPKVEEDLSIPEYFPKAELCKFALAGHVLHMECSNKYVQKVSTFINN